MGHFPSEFSPLIDVTVGKPRNMEYELTWEIKLPEKTNSSKTRQVNAFFISDSTIGSDIHVFWLQNAKNSHILRRPVERDFGIVLSQSCDVRYQCYQQLVTISQAFNGNKLSLIRELQNYLREIIPQKLNYFTTFVFTSNLILQSGLLFLPVITPSYVFPWVVSDIMSEAQTIYRRTHWISSITHFR